MSKRRTPDEAARISACLIVRNEEANLPRCLDSLAGKVDELVVVDTGSTDGTVALAAERGARVFHFPWCDDFSAARNESLRHATGDYVLWIDADDELVERTPGALRRLCERKAAWGYFLDVHCPGNDSTAEVAIVRQWRLFPSKARVRFEGRIHEHPVAPRVIRNDEVLMQDEVHVLHWGYTASGEVLQRKLDRNRRLIERCIADEPHQPRHYFNLGTHLVASGDDPSALLVLLRGIERWFQAHGADTGYVPAMFSAAAATANRLGQPAVALETGQRAPVQFVSSELLLQTGLACQQLGRGAEALEHWRRATADPSALDNIFSDRAAPDKARRAAEELRAALNGGQPLLLSACLIVRDEEANLPRCLESLRDAVDEIVVVDTGSTDRTVEAATSYGARVSTFEWCDDFSAARNESLRQARGKFILWLDADDQLQTADANAIRRLCSQLPASAWGGWVDVHCPTDEWDESVTIARQPRLFRNGIGVEFRGRLHEQATPPPGIDASALERQDVFSIRHWGYIPAGNAPKRRSERNRRLLQLLVDEQPDESFHHYNIALQYAGEGDFEQALPAFEQAMDRWRAFPGSNQGHVPHMFAMVARCAVETGDYARAMAVESRTPDAYVSADLLYYAGLARWRMGDSAGAAERFHRAVEDASLRGHNIHDRSTSTWAALLRLAGVHEEQGDAGRAYDAAQRAAQFAPERPDVQYVLARAMRDIGRIDEALSLARRILAGPRDDGFKAHARELLLQMASDTVDVQCRYDMLSEACTDIPADAAIRLALADLLEGQNLAQEAARVLAAGLDYPPAPAQLYQRLAMILARQGKLEDAANALELASRAAATPGTLSTV